MLPCLTPGEHDQEPGSGTFSRSVATTSTIWYSRARVKPGNHYPRELAPPRCLGEANRLKPVGCKNSVRAPRNRRFAGRTLILAPHTQ
jgi:hypothetical protein